MYSPKISEQLIPQLYRLKLATRKPMTRLVNEAITEYLLKVRGINAPNVLRATENNNITNNNEPRKRVSI